MMAQRGWLRAVVWSVMQTLLKDDTMLLSHEGKSSLTDTEYL